ncbi:MAG: hypothetical protein AAGF99_03690 [Bacteroidota bacterium]
MGRALLLAVAGTIIFSTTLSFNTMETQMGMAQNRFEAQSSELVREIATSGHNLVLTQVLQDDGFKNTLGYTSFDYQGGRIDVAYVPSMDRSEAELELTAFYGGSAHRIKSQYGWLGPDFPGPMWLDVPYLSLDVDPLAVVRGTMDADTRPTYYDRRKFDDLRLGDLLSYPAMEDSARSALSSDAGPGGELQVEYDMAQMLPAFRAPTLDDLYTRALSNMNATDRTLNGNTLVSLYRAYGTVAQPRIVRVTGDLRVLSGGTVKGHGILIVEGSLVVDPGGILEWGGLVFVSGQQEFISIQLDGETTINGALLVDQEALPPGGHLDLTVNRDLSGNWADNAGDKSGSSWLTFGNGYPWYEHTHRFNDEEPEGTQVYFAEGGADRHEHRTRFRETLDALGTEEVYLEFADHMYSGYADFELSVAGQPTYRRSVYNGFGPFRRGNGDARMQSKTFQADQLQDLIVNVRSLRLLRPRFDAEGCAEWPRCIGQDRDRGGAFRVQLRRDADGALLYEATFYWHKRQDEEAEYQAEEQALRDLILSGAAFGTRIDMNDQTDIGFSIDDIEGIGSRLGFALPDVDHQGTVVRHWAEGDADMPTP